MGLRGYVLVVRKHWLSIALFAVLGTAIAALLTLTAPKSYTATAQNFIALSAAPSDSSVLTGAQFAAQRVKSYTEIVSSPDVRHQREEPGALGARFEGSPVGGVSNDPHESSIRERR